MTKSEYLLHRIASEFGITEDDIIAEDSMDSVARGICVRCEEVCDSCEPDATANWCDECEQPAVRSTLVLAGCI